ncbi:NADH:flavin oxidoreductase [Candidatus Pantoea deserta]|uniref:NADH:flavin oxidoreductase n=1 Tax=Candidatus Pantoea deserta TaxID=1869313 RepID=A0A3N4P4L3_9GAMM|nr:NADH:flavin oxidoreductase [Pantoea deserta]RPE03236.1 NADH:flavin oxidoreductase [Pantoea deserta]
MTSRLFTPAALNGTPVKNRAMVAPMTRISASETGVPGEMMQRYYASFARGGFGAVISEGIYVDQAWSQTYAFQPGIVTDEQVAGWRGVVEAVKEQDAVFIAQLIHGGALSQANIYRRSTAAPSAVKPVGQQLSFYHGQGDYAQPEAMSDRQIQQAIDAFAASAERAVNRAGFDGVEIHSANGYLLDQFLTDYTNQRNDRWGGDIEARLRLTLAVIAAVRAKVGPETIVGVRISQGKVNDFHHKWKEGKAGAVKVFAQLQAAGVDYIHVTEYQAWQPAFSDGEQTFAEIAREAAPDTAIVVNGGLDTGELAEAQLEKSADFVAIGKAALANHDWPARVAQGAALRDLPENVLSPVANIKPSEV